MRQMPLLFRRALFGVGSRISAVTIQRLDNAVNYLASARFAADRGLLGAPSFPSREELFARIADDVGRDRTLYLEFGVYRGASMRLWSKLLTNPLSRLHGFDSFEGLPEHWTTVAPRGHYSAGGQIPKIDDSRVTFFKGWFEDTLPTYSLGDYDRLVVSLDADLYSSTKCVLDSLEKAIAPGTYLYFDEFCHRHHEMKAFIEFEARTGMKFEVVGQTGCWERVAFRRIP